jgi:hypothetical protein
MHVRIEPLVHEHYWSILSGNCLTALLAALISLRETTPVYLHEELVEITALQQ